MKKIIIVFCLLFCLVFMSACQRSVNEGQIFIVRSIEKISDGSYKIIINTNLVVYGYQGFIIQTETIPDWAVPGNEIEFVDVIKEEE